ncbi:MAG: hypothetical protein HY300_14460 [Verrucomicrobia bacterium]|nr:hypothetical protein [Verrucomicrobiota bacterium]
MPKPHFTLYIDPDGISAALTQVQGALTVSSTTKKKRGKARTVGTEMGLADGLFTLLSVAKASFKTEAKDEHAEELEEKRDIPTEAQLSALLKSLETYSSTGFFTDLDSAYAKLEQEGSAWVAICDRWNLPAIMSAEGIGAINSEQRFLFTIGDDQDDYEPDDNYYHKSKRDYRVEMAASFDRCPRLKGRKLGVTSHEAILFRVYRGKSIPLNVFGFLLKLDKRLQIIPYKIWLKTS